MALVAKITKVGFEQQVDNGDGTTSTVDLSLRGRFYVVAQYYDTAKPAVILETQNFDFPVDTTPEQVQVAVTNFGRKVRDARVRVTELQQFVGAVIPLT